MAEVWDHAPVKGGALLFLLALADQAGDSDRCAWPGVKQLQHRARCSERSAYDYAAELQECGVLSRLEGDERPDRYSRKKGRETTCWRINPVAEWRGAELAPLRDSVTDPCEGSQVTPARARTRTKNQTEEGENHQNPSGAVRATPRANLRLLKKGIQPDDEETTGRIPGDTPRPPVEEAPDPRSFRSKKEKPERRKTQIELVVDDFAERAMEATDIPLAQRDTSRGALGRMFRKWRDQGIELDEIKQAIDVFFLAPATRLQPDQCLWHAFVNHFPAIHTQQQSTPTRIKHSEQTVVINELAARYGGTS